MKNEEIVSKRIQKFEKALDNFDKQIRHESLLELLLFVEKRFLSILKQKEFANLQRHSFFSYKGIGFQRHI